MKYLGSKARIAYDILPIMLKGMNAGDTFVDAFCGGCNLLDKVPDTFHRIGNDGLVVGTFPSATAAAKAVNGFVTNISAVCLGIRKSYRGYKWKYQ